MVISVNCIPLEEIRNRNSSLVITKGEEEESSNFVCELALIETAQRGREREYSFI